MLKVGDRVRHQNTRKSFGWCKILEINDTTALVRWETHHVRRKAKRPGRTPLSEMESHVNLDSCTPSKS